MIQLHFNEKHAKIGKTKLKVLYIHLRETMHVKYANMECFAETVKYSVKSSGPNTEPWEHH